MDFELNYSQAQAVQSEAKETFFIGGLGSGKSFTLACAVASFAKIPGSVGFLGAPSTDVMKEATWPQVQEALSKLGIEDELHYVVNRRPPAAWGVKPFTKLNSSRIITFAWGSYLIVDGLENFNKRRGAEYDYILVDEFRDVKEAARLVLIARARGREFKKLGMKTRIIYATTPPDNPLYLQELSQQQNDDLRFIMTTSFENNANLPEGYIDSLLNVYDDETAEREVYGLLNAVVKNQFAYKFNEARHCKRLEIEPLDEVYLSFDFNVDPSTALAIQSDGETYIHVLKEFRIPNGDTPSTCHAIEAEYGHIDPYYLITGDATGNNRQSALYGALTHYEIIAEQLHVGASQIKTPASNASITNSRVLLNSMLQNFPDFYIDPEGCPFLVKDLKFVETEMGRNGKIGIKKQGKDKGMDYESMTHLLDCLRYYLQTFHFDFIRKARN